MPDGIGGVGTGQQVFDAGTIQDQQSAQRTDTVIGLGQALGTEPRHPMDAQQSRSQHVPQKQNHTKGIQTCRFPQIL